MYIMYYLKNEFLNRDVINSIVAFYPKDIYFRSYASCLMYDSIADYNIYRHYVFNIPFADFIHHTHYPLSFSSSLSYQLYLKPLDELYEFEN